MDYFKELQGFADRIRSIEPGTYFSRLYQTDNTADDEQRQIISLLQELQLAMESPSLLSVPPEGTVLHLGTAEREVGGALSHLCVALEKCLFFGAEGSMPDFWWVLDRASEGGAAGGGGSEGLTLDGEGMDAGDGSGAKGGGGGSDIRATKTTPEPLAASVHRLTRVHTGHARCRAWARGLLGMDGASAEAELRNAAASVAHLATATTDEPAPRAETGDDQHEKVHAAGTALPSVEDAQVDAIASESDPDAGGGVGRSVGMNSRAAAAAAAAVDLPSHERGHDRSFSPPSVPPPSSSSLLPLWLRSNAKGSSILDDVCRSLVAFSRQLDERGLSIRPSLDHAWLDQESLAAVTTYTWPRFRRARLRCYVRGAGLSAANGEYLPVGTGEGEGGGNDGGVVCDRGLTLLGPNACKICRKARAAAAVDQKEEEFPAAVVSDTAANHLEESPADKGVSGSAVTNEGIGTAAQATTTMAAAPPEAPVAQLWHLLVPAAGSSGIEATRSAYFCLGDGPLPPSRGWRSTDEAGAPAPILRFATQADDDGGFMGAGSERGGREDRRARVTGEERPEDDTALFRAALPPVGVGVVMTEGVSASGTAVEAAGASAETEVIRGGNTSAGPAEAAGRGRYKRRRKRRRPAEGIEDAAGVIGRESPAGDELAVPQRRQAKGELLVENESFLVKNGRGAEARGGGGEGGGRDPAGGGCSNASADDDRGAGCEGGDGEVAAFKEERWRLPEPSGELLERVERSRELLQRTIEESTLSQAMRRRQLQGEIAVAEQEFQEVLKESTDTTVGRVLAARPDLREEAEVEVAVETATAASSGGGADLTVPSLEELVAEKAEELLRTRLRSQGEQQKEEIGRSPSSPPPSSADQGGGSEQRSGGGSMLPVVAVADAGWPWPADWLAAPRVPPPPLFRDVDVLGLALEEDFADLGAGSGDSGRLLSGPEDGGWASGPPVPYSIEVAAVEVADAEDPDAAHIEYVLRVVYRERLQDPVGMTPSVMPETRARGPKESGGAPRAAAVPKGGDRGAAGLSALVTAAKGLLQRTRVLSKRLNSLCAIHPQLVWELEEARRLRPEAEAGARIEEEPLEFPDPFELGTLEESILRVHRDKLTPRFKANSPTRKLSARVGSYLSGLLHFLGVLETAGETSVRSRMAHVLNDALSTCDRAGRKRRRGDFVLGSRVEDIAGGRLGSGGGDEERLRVQKRSCMGCGRAIAAEFLGIKKDYSPCRFGDGLFCRSYCHAEDRRVIPHRVVHHWDFATHRVCKDSRAFLDATRFLPVFDLPELSPALFVEHEVDLRSR